MRDLTATESRATEHGAAPAAGPSARLDEEMFFLPIVELAARIRAGVSKRDVASAA